MGHYQHRAYRYTDVIINSKRGRDRQHHCCPCSHRYHRRHRYCYCHLRCHPLFFAGSFIKTTIKVSTDGLSAYDQTVQMGFLITIIGSTDGLS